MGRESLDDLGESCNLDDDTVPIDFNKVQEDNQVELIRDQLQQAGIDAIQQRLTSHVDEVIEDVDEPSEISPDKPTRSPIPVLAQILKSAKLEKEDLE